jgi:hypothetical protein
MREPEHPRRGGLRQACGAVSCPLGGGAPGEQYRPVLRSALDPIELAKSMHKTMSRSLVARNRSPAAFRIKSQAVPPMSRYRSPRPLKCSRNRASPPTRVPPSSSGRARPRSARPPCPARKGREIAGRPRRHRAAMAIASARIPPGKPGSAQAPSPRIAPSNGLWPRSTLASSRVVARQLAPQPRAQGLPPHPPETIDSVIHDALYSVDEIRPDDEG